MKMYRHSGFTLMEIMVAMTLLSVVGATALSSFSSTTKVVQSKDNTALNIARGYLEAMHEYVRQDTWGNSNAPLAVTNPTLPGANPQTLDATSYNTAYTVDVDPNGNGADYRRTRMTVTW